ncbi:hypothetical protein INR49_027741 [Caranx melampygus]|nr:hypothetical protein INR49_027741 [Caranx melampygus]
MSDVEQCSVGRAVRQVRHGSTSNDNFHAKYGNGLLAGGSIFCVAVWGYNQSVILRQCNVRELTEISSN